MTVPPTPEPETRHPVHLSPRTLVIIAAAWVVPAALAALQRYLQEKLDTQPGVNWNAVVFQSAQWLSLVLLTPITYFMARRYPLRRSNWPSTVAAHLVGALALCAAWASAGVLVERSLMTPTQPNVSHAYRSWFFTMAPWSVAMYFGMLAGIQALAYFAEVRERETQVARLLAQLAEARLDALRQQLNPHFLFNSLNAVTVLVREQNTRAAVRVLELLSDLLRQVLRIEQPQEVPLSEELKFVEQYLAIEQVRFPDRLRVELIVESGAREALVPVFVLQPLVENAIRHGVTRRADAGRITISARRENGMLCLSIKDDGVGIDEHARVEGVGLSNTRERLRTLYGARAILSIAALPSRGSEASIVMPFRSALA